jgi:hypothetical protein
MIHRSCTGIPFSLAGSHISEMLLSYGGASKKSDREISLPPGSYAVIF